MSESLVKQQFVANKLGWKKSFLENFSQNELGESLPWMSYPAIEFLENKITKDHEIFEFGCGASTLFFARKAKNVQGLETNSVWFKIVQKMLREKGLNNAEISLMEGGLENELYEKFAANSGKKFDLIVIDSLKRFKCSQNVIEALKPNGMVILDDSERKNYQKVFNFFAEKGFQKRDFFGIAPGQLRLKNTTVFKEFF